VTARLEYGPPLMCVIDFQKSLKVRYAPLRAVTPTLLRSYKRETFPGADNSAPLRRRYTSIGLIHRSFSLQYSPLRLMLKSAACSRSMPNSCSMTS